ncbi:uncharacterized protein LOC124170493 [Ischnura elegans]|uniref:uncharacterized protein LOC124170493 n=1 Tax=Ischnura elegans TaxID=197161 RepID=UPI001ED89B09|nr:uncharacterized protein LOC124170493 [Ischnura elegans]XP_046405201.1 uncharacterized protein LOC124170493 [Ischnura elegans]
MAFSGPSPMSARVKPVPPPKPSSQLAQSSSQTKVFSQQRTPWEKLAAFSNVGDSKSAKPSRELNLSSGDGREDATESNLKWSPSRVTRASNTRPSALWKNPQEFNLVTPCKSSPVEASALGSRLPLKEPKSLPSGVGDNTRPPLLPKPSSLAARNAPKPPIPKRPDASFLARRTIQESGTQTFPPAENAAGKREPLGKLNISRSSVASSSQHVDNADNSCGSPIRPPRSPKTKPFSGMPFDFASTRHSLSPSQKILSLPHGERQKSFLWSYRESEAVKPGFEDKSQVRAKSCSLERNATLFSMGSALSRPGIRHRDPIPPPRRSKKKSPVVEEVPFLNVHDLDNYNLCSIDNYNINNNIPEYAVVNYELKKNRRLLVATSEEASNEISSHEATAESNERSPPLSTGDLGKSTCFQEGDSSCDFQVSSSEAIADKVAQCPGSDASVRIAQSCPSEWDKECGEFSAKNVINGREESKTAIIGARLPSDEVISDHTKLSATLVNLEINDICCNQFSNKSEPCQEGGGVTTSTTASAVGQCPHEEGRSLTISETITNRFISEYVDNKPQKEVIEGALFSSDNSTVSALEVDRYQPSVGDSFTVIKRTKSLETKITNKAQLPECDYCFSKENNVSNISTVDIDIGESELEQSSKSTLVSHEQGKEASPLPLNVNDEENLRKTSSESDCCAWADAVESKHSDEDDYGRNDSATLPARSRLKADGSDDHCRRQSWSDSQKKESGKQRRKRRGKSLWCDEGDLSSGALGDQSSFEDVPVDDKSGESSNVRRRLSALFSSFGKNSRKSHAVGHKHKEKKIRAITRFHCDLDDDGGNLKVEKPTSEPKNVSDDEKALSPSIQRDGSLKEMDGSSASCADMESRLCEKMDSLDMKRQSGEFGSGSHFSEQSFDNAPSESENEEMLFPEENADASLTEAQRRERKRFYIAQEMMSSERVFVDALRLLCDFRNVISKAGVEQKTEIISEADMGKILHNLPQLLRFNKELLHDLEERISNWSNNQKISDIIVRKGPFLKLYTSYFQNFETQCQYLDDCCDSNTRFARVVREFEASPRCQRLALKHFMLKPIQRLPQYRLLLEDYLSKLDADCTDYADTKVALAIVCDVADHANRSMKQGDALSKLLQLQSLLKNYAIIKPGRTFLKEGELQKLCRKGMQNRYFILLNDCLLYAAYDRSVQAPGSLKVNNELPLNGMKVEIPIAEGYTNEFSIISITRSFTLSASSAQERDEWVNALQNAIQEYTSRQQTFLQMKLAQSNANQKGNEHFQLGTAAPVWIQDCRVTMCQSCTSEFTVTFRRHHCRACGKVVCGKCSANKAPLQYMKYQAARVCDECFESLHQAFEKSTCEPLDLEFGLDAATIASIRASFKKLGQPAAGKRIKFVPQRLKEVCANDTGSQMSGWLQYRNRKSWKKMWFVLKDQVLYIYKASEDIVALESIPILGCQVSIPCELENMKQEEAENGVAFSLTHNNKQFLEFQAENLHSSKRWITAMQEATVLK